jgi:hypothetical protein
MDNYKRCSCCELWKLHNAFSPNKVKRDGLHHHCRECRNQRARERVRARGPRKVQAEKNPTAWMLPRMDLLESLACIQLRKWPAPEWTSREPMRWRVAA